MAEDTKMANDDVFGFDEASASVFAAFTESKAKPIVERVKISDGGRLVIPAAMRAAMKVEVGDTVTLRLYPSGELSVISKAAALASLRHSNFPKFADDGVSWVDELIAERRAEAQKNVDEALEFEARLAAREQQ
jgi:bifunctional DNA-binding transcriptional regulator/antitoxin component of YhaV-PrlF toxin-antitoxin module